MSTTVAKPRGRHFFANPGPTNIPNSVLRAIDRPSIDFHDPDFREVYDASFEGVKRVLRTQHRLFMYTGSGHAAWEASLTNLLSPGDAILLLEFGYFSDEWAKMARALKVEVRQVAADWRHGVDIANVKAALAEDTAHVIKAVCVVHNETATGLFIPIPEVRAAIECGAASGAVAGGHDFLAGVDRLPHGRVEDRWRGRRRPEGPDAPDGHELHRRLAEGPGSAPRGKARALLFRLDADARPQSAELRRHNTGELLLWAEGVAPAAGGGRPAERLCAPPPAGRGGAPCGAGLAGNSGPQLFCTNPGRYSDSVTAVWMPEGHDAEALRRTARQRFNVSLGGGLGKLNGRVFQIGHLGDLNEPMVLGALSAVEMSLRINNVPHGKGGVDAAMDYLAA